MGRAAELTGLTSSCLGGPAGVSLVSGDAGCGKTRLLDEVAHRVAAAGGLVLRGRAVPGGGAYRPLAEALIPAAPPSLAAHDRLAPFRAVLARVLPAWPPGAAGGVHLVDPAVVLGEAVLELLRVVADGGRPSVVVLDDLHWADQESLAVLGYLAGALPRRPPARVRVLGAARDEDPDAGDGAVLPAVPDVVRLPLSRLGDADVASLVRGLADGGLPAAVEEHLVDGADGLPLLAEELFAGLVDEGVLQRGATGWEVRGRLVPRVPGTLDRKSVV